MSDYMCDPGSHAVGGVLVLHAWWGLNDFQRDTCDRLAREGFAVIAPDLCDGAIARSVPEARRLRRTILRPAASKHLLQTLGRLRRKVSPARVGVLGFSLGAYLALWLAESTPRSINATILFYGTRTGQYRHSQSTFMGHFAADDEYVSASGRERLERSLRAAGKAVKFLLYPGTRHWFFEADRPEFDIEAATLAWSRSVAELHRHLG
jgi:carboxymethylenebutenolidase